MRELAKSMIRFSWAMSVFSLDQLGNLLGESKRETEETTDDTEATGQGCQRSTQSDRQRTIAGSLDDVVDATGTHFSERSRNLFDSGDQLQGEMVDMFFDFISADRWKAETILDRTADLMEDTADALRRAASTEDTDDADHTSDSEAAEQESTEADERGSAQRVDESDAPVQ